MRNLRRTKRATSVAVLAGLWLVVSLVLASPAAAQSWSPAGNLSVAREGHLSTLLADGRVLVTGGFSTTTGYDTRLAEVYDPATNSWSPTGSTANGRIGHIATLLLDGRVLVAGGINANICANDATSEVWNPATGTWSFSGNLPFATHGATGTLLNDGKVLLAGGGNRCGGVFNGASLYDPATGTWSPTGSMGTVREHANAVRLADGRVLVAGGQTITSPFFPPTNTAEIYIPATGTWAPTGSMATTRCCGQFLTLLADGRVMALSGYSGNGFNNFPNGPQVEIYDPATGVWTPTGSLGVARSSGTFSLLNDGKVLAAGGFDGTNAHASAELWEPATGTWSATASMAGTRWSHASSVLANGKVLVSGGENSPPERTILASAELYSPHVPNPCATIYAHGTLKSNNARFELRARYKSATQTFEGSATYDDPAGGMSFSSTAITGIDNMGGTAKITGQGTANGLPVTFEITVAEVAKYFFSIELSNGYSAASSLKVGRVRITDDC